MKCRQCPVPGCWHVGCNKRQKYNKHLLYCEECKNLSLAVKAPPGERAVNESVCRQERQRSPFGWRIGGTDAATPLLWPRAAWPSRLDDTNGAFPQPSLCQLQDQQYLQIYLPLKSTQVYQRNRDSITELCAHMFCIPPAIIPSSSYATYLVHSSSMVIINMLSGKKMIARSKQTEKLAR